MCGPGPCVYGCLSVRVPSQAAVGSTVVPDSLVVADGPLAETDVSGVVGSGSVSVGLGLSVGSVGLWVGVGVVGVFVGDLVGDLVGVPGVLGLPVGGLPDDDGLSLGPVDPVDGAPLPLGVARLPDGPGVEGLPLDEPLRGVEASVGSSAGNPPSMPSSSAGCSVVTPPPSWASLLDVMPSVTTVPSTAASTTPAPAATTLRRAPPSTAALRPPDAPVPAAGATRDISAVSSSDLRGAAFGPLTGMVTGGRADSSYRAAGVSSPDGRLPGTCPPERSETRASARRPATAPDLSASAPRIPIEASSSALARSRLPVQSARTPNSWWK